MAINVKEVIEKNNERYGKPEVQLAKAAELWSTYLSMNIRSRDICMLMILLKISRELCGKGDPDNTQDIHGYTMIYDELKHPAQELKPGSLIPTEEVSEYSKGTKP